MLLKDIQIANFDEVGSMGSIQSLTNDISPEVDHYKRPWKKPEPKQPRLDALCFYSRLSVVFQGLFVEGWTTLDWLDDCSLVDIENRLESLKETNPAICLRAVNRITGRMMDFA